MGEEAGMKKRPASSETILGNVFDRVLGDKYGIPKKTMARARKARGVALQEKHLPKKPPKQDVVLARAQKKSWKLVRTGSDGIKYIVKSIRVSASLWAVLNNAMARRGAKSRGAAASRMHGDISTFMRRLMLEGLLQSQDLTAKERKQVSLLVRANDLVEAARDAQSLAEVP